MGRLAVLITLIVLIIVTGFVLKNRLIFHPTTEIYELPSNYGLKYDELWVEIEPGLKVKVWRVHSPYQDMEAKTAIVLQGNSGNVSLMTTRLVMLAYMGLTVFSADYPGYGQNEGSPTEEGAYKTAEALWNLATQEGATQENILIFGFSIGGGVAGYLAEAHPPAALVLDSTFTKLSDVPATQYPFLRPYARLIVGDAFNTKARLANIRCPLLVLHSTEDEIVPYELGQDLFNTYQNNCKDMGVGVGDHLGFMLNSPIYREKIARLLVAGGLLTSTEPRPGSWPVLPINRPE